MKKKDKISITYSLYSFLYMKMMKKIIVYGIFAE